MLVLTRKENQKVIMDVAGVRIVVNVVKACGSKAILAIDAPADVQIVREELLQKDSRKNGRNGKKGKQQ